MKLIDNCTLEEIKDLLCEVVTYDTIELTYDYLHRNKTYTIQYFANSKKISVTTLYRKVNKVIELYERYSKTN